MSLRLDLTMSFWRRRKEADRTTPSALGHLEFTVMEVLWLSGESNVRDVAAQLERPLAYTTVMTTLDRLYKKGILSRRKVERAYVYSPLLSRQEWEQRVAAEMMAGLLAGPPALISCFVDAVGSYDERILDALERKIQLKRRELEKKRKP